VVVVPQRVLDNPASPNFTTLPVPVPGDYTIQIEHGGCIATFDVTIVSDPTTAVTFTPDLCNAQISALPAGASYNWSTSEAGSISGSTSSQTVTLNPGTWNLEVEVDDGVNCPGTGIITVTVEPALTASFVASDPCENQVTLSASPTGPYTYLWRNVTTGTNIIGGSSIIIGIANNGDTFEVRVQSTLTGCFDVSNQQQVFVAGDLQLTMTTTTPCTGTPFTLTATSNIGGTGFQWAVNGGNIAGAIQPTLNRSTGGLYRVTGTLPGCSEFIEQQIILFPTTAGSLPARALICNDPANPDPNTRQITLDVGANFVSYQWKQGGAELTGETNQTLLVTEAAIYSVDLENSYGCPSTDQTDVIEECKARIVAPTAFRPGSSNEETNAFYIFSFFVSTENFQIFIYNRWGELIHQSSELDFRWNGDYKNSGQLVPAGTYTYVVKYKSEYRPQDGIQEQRGVVVLLR
jgi:gliding motility-associated-like protein